MRGYTGTYIPDPSEYEPPYDGPEEEPDDNEDAGIFDDKLE